MTRHIVKLDVFAQVEATAALSAEKSPNRMIVSKHDIGCLPG
jgi:hypothetical protein